MGTWQNHNKMVMKSTNYSTTTSSMNNARWSTIVEDDLKQKKNAVVVKARRSSMYNLGSGAASRKHTSAGLRRLLKEDLHVRSRKVASCTSLRSPLKKQRRSSLHDIHSDDIAVLLRSLRSTGFVGSIDPVHHSRYFNQQ